MRQRSDVTVIAREVLAFLSEPYDLYGATVRVGASIGIALANEGNIDLAAAADAALYDAKRSGRGTFRFAKDEPLLRLIA